MNLYQRRLGLLLGSTALLILLVSSGAQSTIGYAKFASAYSQATQTCPNFPNPVSILFGSSTLGFLTNANVTEKNYEFHTYIRHFSVSGLWLNNTSIGFGHLQATIFTTQTWFWHNNGTKSDQTNTTLNIIVQNFAARVSQHQAIVTAQHGEGNYTTTSLNAWPPLFVKVSGDNLKGTVSCGAT